MTSPACTPRLARWSAHCAIGGATLALLAGCTTMTDTAMTDNPAPPIARASQTGLPPIPQATGYFAQESTLPFHAPDFAQIEDADYLPAIKQGMAVHRAEIARITANPAAPDFANTIVAMERSGQMLSRTLAVFGQVQGANTNATLDATESEVAPLLAQHSDAIYLDPALFARVRAVYDARTAMTMPPEDAMLLETAHARFIHAGANLAPAQKEQLKGFNTRIAALESEFSQKLTDATNADALVVKDEAALAGLPAGDIARAAQAATDKGMPGQYLLTLQNTTQQPQLAQLTNRATRRALYEKSVSRAAGGGADDTTGIVRELSALRAQKAALLGAPNYASYQMYDRMVTDPAKAIGFMEQMVPALAATQRREAARLTQEIKAGGQSFAVQPYDWQIYAERVRKKEYDLDEATVKPYFELTRVLEDGVFYAANQLYGLTFDKRSDLPVYHPDVSVYTVHDADGSDLGLFYFDPFKRDNKQGGAWMNNFVEQSYLLDQKPVIANTLNIPKPPAGEPVLVSFDNVTTMFHEFGHALHGMFASQTYPALSGTNTARDWVEFPSQFNENFATVPKVLQHYARHYQTGETIPATLIAKIERAAKFDQGYALGETLEAALLDMKWHTLPQGQTPTDVMGFEATALNSLGLATDTVPPRYRTPYFRHIWSNGYSAGYYSYLWTEMLAHDAYDWVDNHGGMTRANGQHIRDSFLGQGHTKDYATLYRDFAGRDPSVQAMLEARGLVAAPPGERTAPDAVVPVGDET